MQHFCQDSYVKTFESVGFVVPEFLELLHFVRSFRKVLLKNSDKVAFDLPLFPFVAVELLPIEQSEKVKREFAIFAVLNSAG